MPLAQVYVALTAIYLIAYSLTSLVDFEWQPIRISKKSKPLAGVLVDPHCFHREALCLELLFGKLHIGHRKTQVPQATRLRA